jgi:hypothetical protein
LSLVFTNKLNSNKMCDYKFYNITLTAPIT